MVDILVITDTNCIWGTAVTVRSVLERCSSLCNIYVISVDLTSNEQRLLIDSWQTDNTGKIEFISFDKSKVAPFRTTLHVRSKVAYARLFIDDCLPNLSRIIYLDTDLIVCADIKKLYDMDLMGNTAACACDIGVFNEYQRQRFQDKLGLKNSSLYFNSGVMLIDLQAWKERQIQSKSIQTSLEMYDFLDLVDQDALNVVLEDDWLKLDQKWNTSKYDAPDSFDDGIIHLLGRVKPWHADYDFKFKDRFFAILDRTAFAGWRPAKLMGMGAVYKKASRFVPTLEMVQGKLRRLLQ